MRWPARTTRSPTTTGGRRRSQALIDAEAAAFLGDKERLGLRTASRSCSIRRPIRPWRWCCTSWSPTRRSMAACRCRTAARGIGWHLDAKRRPRCSTWSRERRPAGRRRRAARASAQPSSSVSIPYDLGGAAEMRYLREAGIDGLLPHSGAPCGRAASHGASSPTRYQRSAPGHPQAQPRDRFSRAGRSCWSRTA